MDEWLYVDDSLPECSCYVLVNNGFNSITIAFFDYVRCQFSDIFGNGSDTLMTAYIAQSDRLVYFDVSDIDYWRHLPLCPNEE